MTMIQTLQLFELLACLCGFLNWKKIKYSYWKWFAIFLMFIVIAEFIGSFLRRPDRSAFNLILYDFIVIPGEFYFYFWLLARSFPRKRYRQLMVLFALLYCISWCVEMLYFAHTSFFFYSLSYMTGNLLLLVAILIFFLRLITSNEILHFKHNMMFWVCVGLLVFYIGGLPYFGLHNTLAHSYRHILIVYYRVMLMLDYLMYIFFSIAFIWGKPNSSFS